MPHVNYKRGETIVFVFRREHGKTTNDTCYKGKRMSYKAYKNFFARKLRRETTVFFLNPEDTALPYQRRGVRWMAS